MEISLNSGLSLRNLYRKVVEAVIRPPKNQYSVEKLGPVYFSLKNGKKFKRIDQKIPHGQDTLELSLFLPYSQSNPTGLPQNLILFCHCNASNRLECLQYIEYLPWNYGIAGFDFLGCGNAKETFISLGLRESSQIRTILQSLNRQFAKVVPWGRSMGATSVLMYGQSPISVVDSPFSSLKSLGKDYITHNAEKNRCLLSCIFPCLWVCVKSSVLRRAKFNMSDVSSSNAVQNMSKSQGIIFIASKNDELVPSSHAQKLYRNFQSDKKALLLVEGDHNSLRKKQTFDEVISLIERFSMDSPSVPSLASNIDPGRSTANLC